LDWLGLAWIGLDWLANKGLLVKTFRVALSIWLVGN